MVYHIKYQLLIQRLVLFFYPMVAQIPLQQRLSRTFLEKAFWSSFIFHYTNRRGEQFCLPRLCLLLHPGQNDVFLISVKSFRSVNMWLSHRLHQLKQQLFLSLCECTPFWKSSCCSEVKALASVLSEKNWTSVIPKPLQTVSSVGRVGALFRLNILVTVEWERFASFARR